MKFDAAYLRMVLARAPADRIAELFKRRREIIHRDDGAGPEKPKEVMSPAEIEERLTRVEQQLFTASIEENEHELLLLLNQADTPAQRWKRLKVINENREVLATIAGQSAQWKAILGRIENVMSQSITDREEARNWFFDEVTPIILRPKSRINEVWGLTQKYGDKHMFEALMCRLLVDAPDFYELEKPFFERFNPHVTSGLGSFRSETTAARARYCPLQKSKPAPPRSHEKTVAMVTFVVTVALMILG